MTTAGASGEVFAAARGSDVATSFLGASSRLTATDSDTVNVSTPATSRATGPVWAELPATVPGGPARIDAGNAGNVGAVDEREVDVLRGHQCGAAREGELGFCGGEHRNGQGVLEDRHHLVVSARTDHDQGLGLPIGAGEHRAQPPDQVLLGDDRVVDRGLHGAVADVHDQRDHRVGLEHAHRGGVEPDHLGDPRANAAVASGSRTAMTLAKPESVRDFNSSDASASASSLQVTPMECRR